MLKNMGVCSGASCNNIVLVNIKINKKKSIVKQMSN